MKGLYICSWDFYSAYLLSTTTLENNGNNQSSNECFSLVIMPMHNRSVHCLLLDVGPKKPPKLLKDAKIIYK